MAALTFDRTTPRRYVERTTAEDALVAANTTIWALSLVCANANGELRPGADVAGLTFVGVAQRRMVNPAGVAARVKPAALCAAGVYKFGTISGANAITAADLGKQCFIVDDQTVARQAGTSNAIPAGTVDAVDTDGVWVKSANL